MKKIIVSLIAVFAIAVSANAANYSADENSIDALIENCVEVSPLELAAEAPASAAASISSGNEAIISFVLCTFVGWCGIHRYYLGCGKKWIGVLYFVACCCFVGSVIVLIDWIFLLLGVIDDNVSAYQNNDNVLMWL